MPNERPLDSEVLHQQTGLKIRRNIKNRFVIVELDYFADPAKRSKEWEEETKAGMSAAGFAKEYQRDAGALYGARVWPEFAQHKNKIVLEAPYMEFPSTQIFWGGYDFGSRNPSSFHVYTIVDGVHLAVWELYEPAKNVDDWCQKMLACPYWDQIKYVACDPTIIEQKSKTNASGAFVTLAELMAEHGIKKLIPGNRSESVWVETVRQHWKTPEDPTFQIFSCCPKLIYEFENAVYASESQREVLTQTYREQLADANNHALDDNKYYFNSRPSARAAERKAWVDPKMYTRWRH